MWIEIVVVVGAAFERAAGRRPFTFIHRQSRALARPNA